MSDKLLPTGKKSPVKVLNVRLPDDVIAWLDSLVERGIYNNRSEAVRDFLRNYVVDKRG
jgi:Arc/MetJ-type ribon-helix-helix transcriptional regulator